MWLKTRKNGVTLSDYTVPLLQLSFRTARRGRLFCFALYFGFADDRAVIGCNIFGDGGREDLEFF